MSRRQTLKEQKRFALIEAGMRLFMRDGFGPTTVDQITALANVAKGTFYNYFTTKEDLLVAGMLVIQAEAAEAVRLEIFALPETSQRLRRLARWTGEWVAAHPELAAVWCLERLRRGCHDDGLSGFDELLIQIIMDGLAAGHLRADRQPSAMVTEISGMLITYILMRQPGDQPFSLVEQMEDALAAYLTGNRFQ